MNRKASRGTGRNRTADTTIFSRMLYQLSYSPLHLELPNITAFKLYKKEAFIFLFIFPQVNITEPYLK